MALSLRAQPVIADATRVATRNLGEPALSWSATNLPFASRRELPQLRFAVCGMTAARYPG